MSDAESNLETITKKEANKLVLNSMRNKLIIAGCGAVAMVASATLIYVTAPDAPLVVIAISSGVMGGGVAAFSKPLFGTYNTLTDYLRDAKTYVRTHYNKQLI